MATNVVNKCTIVELEHPDTSKVCLANCICCAKSRLAEKGLFEDSSAIYVCTKEVRKNKKPEFHILADLNYCCSKFELSRDFINLGYRVVGKYSTKIAKDKKVIK